MAFPAEADLPPSSRIFSIANQKGGVGKTTTAINLGTALAATGRKILLIDLDPQGNASTGLGVGRTARRMSALDLLQRRAGVGSIAQKTAVPGLDLVPSVVDLSGLEIELAADQRRAYRLREALKNLRGYDYVLIDCPPSLGVLTVNALVASGAVLVPLQCEFFALEGLSLLLRTIERVRQGHNPALEMHGVVLTMFDKRNNLSEQVEADVRGFLGDRVYETVIPRNIRISEAPSHGQPVLTYDVRSAGARAYALLARELLMREGKIAPAA